MLRRVVDITRRENYERSRENTAQQLHLQYCSSWKKKPTEDKAKVVAVVWGTDLNAALAI